MALTLTDEQAAVRNAARDYLRDHARLERLRQIIDGTAGWDRELWEGFSVELGFAGVGIAEEDGGMGLGPIEQAMILEELGQTLAPIPWFESVVLAGRVIAATATPDQRKILLGGIATGKTIATLAMLESSGISAPIGIGPQICGTTGQWTLAGEAHYVPFGHVASLLIVAARHPGTIGWDGLSLIALPADTPGISVTRVVSLDLTRPYAAVRFDNVLLDEAQWLGAAGKAGPAFRRALIGAAGLLAAEQLGGAARLLEETVAYAKDRIQFGRTIGSFQAVKHRLADMKLLVDYSRSASDWAARSIAVDDDFEAAASGARSYCSDAFLVCASDAIQLHGGIGFTWEHHAHLFFKRARSSSTLLGSPVEHRAAIARIIIDQAIDNRSLSE